MKKAIFPPQGYRVMTLRSVLEKSTLSPEQIDLFCIEEEKARQKYTVCVLDGCGDSLVATRKIYPNELVTYFLGDIKEFDPIKSYRYAYRISEDKIVDPEFSGNEASRMPHLFSKDELDDFVEFSPGQREQVAEENVKIELVSVPGLDDPLLRVSAITEILPKGPIGFSYQSCALGECDIVILNKKSQPMPASAFKIIGTLLRIKEKNPQVLREYIELDLRYNEFKHEIGIKSLPLPKDQKSPQCLVTFNNIGLRGVCGSADSKRLFKRSIYSAIDFSACEDGVSILAETLEASDQDNLNSKQTYEYLRNIIKLINLSLARFEKSSDNFSPFITKSLNSFLTLLLIFMYKQQTKKPQFPGRPDFLWALQTMFSKIDQSSYKDEIPDNIGKLIKKCELILSKNYAKNSNSFARVLLIVCLTYHHTRQVSKQNISILLRVGFCLTFGKNSPSIKSLRDKPIPAFFRDMLPNAMQMAKAQGVHLTTRQIAAAVNKTCLALS